MQKLGAMFNREINPEVNSQISVVEFHKKHIYNLAEGRGEGHSGQFKKNHPT
jgi:hypothetical protein